jgi:hypothetical protein
VYGFAIVGVYELELEKSNEEKFPFDCVVDTKFFVVNPF